MIDSSFDIDRLIAGTFVASVEHHPTIGSTNDRARQIAAESGLRLPALILADQQTAGRGRRSNRWWSGPGSLAFSLLLEPSALGIARRDAPQLSLASALALVDWLRSELPQFEIGLHWPNDVFVAGRKVAGILVEVLPDGKHILGIGLNTNSTLQDAPAELHGVAATLRDLAGQTFDRSETLMALLSRLEVHLCQLGEAPEQFGRKYNEACLQRGKTLVLQTGEQLTTGQCRGIASDGALLLETAAGTQRFYGGFLVHRSTTAGTYSSDSASRNPCP